MIMIFKNTIMSKKEIQKESLTCRLVKQVLTEIYLNKLNSNDEIISTINLKWELERIFAFPFIVDELKTNDKNKVIFKVSYFFEGDITEIATSFTKE